MTPVVVDVVVVVVGVVVVVVVVGGGITFIHGLSREPMYGFKEFNSITPYFYHFLSFFVSKAHVWFECPCMVQKGRGGHTLF